jgi:hypothetical protein
LRVLALKRLSLVIAFSLSGLLLVLAGASTAHAADSGGAGILTALPPFDNGGGAPPTTVTPPTTPLPTAVLSKNGRTAIPPASAPQPVKDAVYAANRITRKPYRYGGGHRSFRDTAYDCSGAVSYALHGGGILQSPLFSSLFMSWGDPGRGQWITVYTNPGHAWAIIAGLRLDTSGPGESGPRWRTEKRSARGFRARHPLSL